MLQRSTSYSEYTVDQTSWQTGEPTCLLFPLDSESLPNKLNLRSLDRIRLRALGEDLVDHSWIFESLKQHRKLDFADYSFSRFDEVAQLYRDQPQAATQQALASVIESASEGIRENRDGHVQSEEAR